MILTEKDFRAYLATMDSRDAIGERAHAHACPLATWMNATWSGAPWTVDQWTYWSKGAQAQDLPRWAVMLVALVDKTARPHAPTVAECLAHLEYIDASQGDPYPSEVDQS